jgi:tetratricopeptide (TPR) repeat protein
MSGSPDFVIQFAKLNESVQDRNISSIYVRNLMALRELFLSHEETLVREPVVRAIMAFRHPEHYKWKLLFDLGSGNLFNPEGDRQQNIDAAITWLGRALQTPIREIDPADWARTQGELATAYKNRPIGNREENVAQAMACIGEALEVFTPETYFQEWLITIKQRAILRLEASRTAEAFRSLEEVERAIAELEVVAGHADRSANFNFWASAQAALAAAYEKRGIGYFVDNAERSKEVCEELLAEVGDLETMMREGAERERMHVAAAATINLANAFQIRRVGDSNANAMRATALLRSARKYFQATNQNDVTQYIDRRLQALQSESG